MSYRWSPEDDPRDAGRQRPSYPQQPPRYDDPRSGYGAPGPRSGGRPGGWPAQQNDPWSEWGEPPTQGSYHPGRPYPQSHPYADAPYGNPDPYGMGDPYSGYGPQGPYGNQPAPRRRSRNWLLPLMILLVLILVAGVGAYALKTYGPQSGGHGTASGTPSVPAGFHTDTNSAIGARFVVPDGWTTNDNLTVSGGHGMQATSPDGSAALIVGSLPEVGDLTGGANGALAGMSGSGSVANKEGPSNVTIAGTSWVREAGDITRSGVRLHAVVLLTTHGGHTYLLAFVATTSSFHDDDTRYFQITTQSFQFLS